MSVYRSLSSDVCQIMSLYQKHTIQAAKFNDALRLLKNVELPTTIRFLIAV